MNQFLSRDDLVHWLSELLKERILITPTESDGLLLFQPISKVEDIILDFENTALSPKGWFFPPTETLVTIKSQDGHTELIPATAEQEAVILGVRPCDARGIALMNKPFLQEPSDRLYQQRRAQTTIIGLACSRVRPECFCTSMGSAPNDPTYSDVLLTEADDGYVAQAITEKGKALLSHSPAVDTEATIPSPPSPEIVPAEGIVPVIRGFFDDIYWEHLADRCLHCNICAYVCPTCYCFDVRDFPNKGGIDRVRTWESCQSPGFTRIAGGYDPRASKGARLKQRFYHKLLYFAEEFEASACVGCGRCVRLCPVNIDIREVITDIQRLGAKSGR